MRIRTWQPTGQLMAPPPGPVGPPCCVPCCPQPCCPAGYQPAAAGVAAPVPAVQPVPVVPAGAQGWARPGYTPCVPCQ